MQIHLSSLALGGVLVAGGFMLGSGALPTRAAQAGATADANGWVVTSDDAVPGRIYVWATSGSDLRSVSIHDCDRAAGTVTSRKIEPAPPAGFGGGR